MKKVLSLLMMLMLAIGAWAGEVTDVLTGAATGVTGSSYTEWSGVTLNSEAVYAGQSAGSNNSIQLRSKNNNSGVITTASGGTVKSVTVVFESHTMDGRTLNVYGKNSAYSAATDLYDSSLQGELLGSFVKGEETSSLTVSGDYEYIAFRSAADAMYIESITIVWETEGEPPVTVTPPTFSPAAGEVVAGTEVTITAPDAEMIIYTIDGTDPSYEEDNGEIYTDPIVVNQAMTIKAIAVDADDNVSSVASAAYTIKQEGVTCATVAEIKALADDTEFTFTGQLVVSGHAHATSGTNNWLFAQDETGGLQLFKATQDYQKDDVIPSGFTAIKKTYGGAAQLQSMANMQAATETQELVAEELTPAQVGLDNVFKYAVIKGATIANNNITVGEESVVIYNNRFNTTIPTDANTYDVYGITSYYNGTPQFMPLEFILQKEVETLPTPVISGETPFTESTQVTITCEDEEATIYYTLDGTEPSSQSTVYTEPFTLTETTTVKAIAIISGFAVISSEVATKEFVKEEPAPTCATVTEILALENNTVFTFTGTMTAIAQATSANGNSKYLYAQDADGVGMLFFNAPVDYNMGDVIPAGWEAKRTNYKGAPELTTFSNMTAATETAELTPAEMTPAQVTVDPYNLFHLAVIKGASLGENGAIVAGEESVAGYYDRFGVTFPEDNEGKTYDVYGIPSWYNNAQFMPLEIVEVVEPVVTEVEELYVVGTFNNWSQVDGMVELTDNGNYELAGNVDFEAGAEFKLITPVGESWKWFGGEDANGVGYFLINNDLLETPISLVDGANFRIEEAGNYNITVSTAETKGLPLPLAMVVTKTPTAIEAINMENVKAVRYYNVAGVESATPFQGVNIVVREMTDGSKSVIKIVK
jgi:hypothetical protein